MNVDPVRTYMSHALLVAYAVRHGRSYEHLLEPLAAAEKQLGGARKTIVDRRLNRAVAELLDGADPPRPARMNVEGMTAVDADLYAEELLAIYRDRLRDLGRPSWKDPIRKDASQKIAQLEERQRAKAAAKAVEKSNTAAAPAAVVEKAANADARLRELGEE